MTHTPHYLRSTLSLKPVPLQSLHPPPPLHPHCWLHHSPRYFTFFAKCPAKFDASPFRAHVCHFVITMAPITLTPQNTSPSCISLANRSVHASNEQEGPFPATVIAPLRRYQLLFLFQSISEYSCTFPLGSPRNTRCRLRGLLLSVSTIRSSTRVQVNIYALTFVPCTRLIILGNELLIGSNTSLTDPSFRHLSSSIAFSIRAQLTNVRIIRSLLAISSLLNPSLRLLRAPPPPPDLAGISSFSGARG
jgi:hypothetical protein